MFQQILFLSLQEYMRDISRQLRFIREQTNK